MPNRCVVWIVLVFVLSTASQAEAGQLSAQIENSLLVTADEIQISPNAP